MTYTSTTESTVDIAEANPKTAERYSPIPSFPASLGGEWKIIVRKPYLKASMRFRSGSCLPPHHFPTAVRIKVVRGSIWLHDLQNDQMYLIGQGEDCLIPAMLIHTIEYPQDTELDFAMDSNDMVIYWDFEER